ncbi:MAG: ABC transporter substrate-binding protein [Fibrobacter sp.]|nr:ABC transporter substrate-binding protein [Fibrobacter sp.]
MNANFKIFLTALVAFGFALITGACDGEKKETSKYKFGTVELPVLDGALCGIPFFVAKEKGFFEEEGFDVKLIAADGETRKLGLSKGTYPLTNSDFQFFQAIENGVDIKIVDGIHIGCIKVLVKKGSSIAKASDLKGKKIAVDEIGGTPHQAVSLWLSVGGVSTKPEDGEVQFLPYADGNLALEALEQGQIDAAAIWDPLATSYEKSGKADVIMDVATDPVFDGRYCCFIYVSAKILHENPEKIAALLRAIHKAEAWIADHPEEAVDITAEGKYSEIEDKALAVELVKAYVYTSQEQQKKLGRDVKSDLRYFSEKLHQIGYLTKEPDQFVKDLFEEVNLSK